MKNNRRPFLIICTIIGLLSGFLLTLNTGATIMVFFGFLLGSLVIFAISQPEDHKFLFRIFTIGFLSRLLLSTVFHFFALSFPAERKGFFIADDGIDASYNGWEITKLWHTGLIPDNDMVRSVCPSTRLGSYHYWNAFVYYFTDWNPLVMFYINCLAGALTIILIYMIAKEIFNKRVAIISALLFAFWPSTFLWSTMNSKEPLTILFICLATWSFINLRRKFTIGYLSMTLLPLLLLYKFRIIASVLLAFAIFLSFLLPYKTTNEKNFLPRLIKRIVIFTAILIMCFNIKTVEKYFIARLGGSHSIIEAIDYAHYVRTLGAGSAFLVDANISSPIRTFLYLPFAISIAIFAPFPWKISSHLQLMAAPEMLIWYILLPFIFRGFLLAIKYRWNECSVIVIFVALMWLALALIEGNAGTLFRHRSFLIPFCLIAAAVGLVKEGLKKEPLA